MRMEPGAIQSGTKFTSDQVEKVAVELHALRLHAQESARTYGQAVIRGLFLLNGGASVAILTLVGALYGRSEQSSIRLANVIIDHVALSLLLFSIGLLLTVIASGIGYFNYLLLNAALPNPWEARSEYAAEVTKDRRSKRNLWVDRTMYVATCACLGSFFMFVFGGWHFYRTLVFASHLAS